MIDGDGSITMTKIYREEGRQERDRAVVSIANSYRPLLEWVQERCGGAITARSQVCPEDCYSIHVHTRKVGYRWIIRGERAVIILRNIRGYLIEKQERADRVIELGTPPRLSNAAIGVQKKMREAGW